MSDPTDENAAPPAQTQVQGNERSAFGNDDFFTAAIKTLFVQFNTNSMWEPAVRSEILHRSYGGDALRTAADIMRDAWSNITSGNAPDNTQRTQYGVSALPASRYTAPSEASDALRRIYERADTLHHGRMKEVSAGAREEFGGMAAPANIDAAPDATPDALPDAAPPAATPEIDKDANLDTGRRYAVNYAELSLPSVA